MNKKVTKEQVKEVILKVIGEMEVTVKDIILFGSRAKGNYTNNSDWDLLIITEKTYNIKEKMAIMKKINQDLAKLYIPCDILINSVEEVENKRVKIGYVTKTAIAEGIKI